MPESRFSIAVQSDKKNNGVFNTTKTRYYEVCLLVNRTDHLFIDFKKAYDSVRREVCTIRILVEFGAD
jgi:hypothetical protein